MARSFDIRIRDLQLRFEDVIAIVMCILFACVGIRIQSLRLAEVGARCGGANKHPYVYSTSAVHFTFPDIGTGASACNSELD